MEDALTSAHDLHNATITVRVIKSFEYRTIRNHVFRNVDLSIWTPLTILEETKALVAVTGGFRPYRTVEFNAVKVYTHAHFTKTQNLSINLDHDDDWVLTDGDKVKTPLCELGVKNETELSVFNAAAYTQFKSNPVQRW